MQVRRATTSSNKAQLTCWGGESRSGSIETAMETGVEGSMETGVEGAIEDGFEVTIETAFETGFHSLRGRSRSSDSESDPLPRSDA